MANEPITLEKMKAYVDATWEKCQAEAWQVQEPIAWVYPEGLEALKSGRPWTAYGSNGDGRIPLYLNDAVAPKAEPRSGESGAGFESLPASPTWWDEPVAQMNYRKWQGLTEVEKVNVAIECGCADVAWMDFADAIEAKLKAKNS